MHSQPNTSPLVHVQVPTQVKVRIQTKRTSTFTPSLFCCVLTFHPDAILTTNGLFLNCILYRDFTTIFQH